ncbi:lipoprotein LpqH [Mycolicibacterium hodleri]|uniref:lipoprotein LpqH n=1 Tax=Mycolicibacterium hodleri TaxID=49897 RepID=UPI00137611E5|nr:lipoprotein LpqH [Mycolicibacterium hodleri]
MIPVVLTIACITGCSSPSSAPRQQGSMPVGTAEVTVNDQKLATSKSVACSIEQATTTIQTGDDNAGTTVIVDNSGKPVARSVVIRNLGGFTGSYSQDLGPSADVKWTGRTVTVAGTADGFNADNPSVRATGQFSIAVSC